MGGRVFKILFILKGLQRKWVALIESFEADVDLAFFSSFFGAHGTCSSFIHTSLPVMHFADHSILLLII